MPADPHHTPRAPRSEQTRCNGIATSWDHSWNRSTENIPVIASVRDGDSEDWLFIARASANGWRDAQLRPPVGRRTRCRRQKPAPHELDGSAARAADPVLRPQSVDGSWSARCLRSNTGPGWVVISGSGVPRGTPGDRRRFLDAGVHPGRLGGRRAIPDSASRVDLAAMRNPSRMLNRP